MDPTVSSVARTDFVPHPCEPWHAKSFAGVQRAGGSVGSRIFSASVSSVIHPQMGMDQILKHLTSGCPCFHFWGPRGPFWGFPIFRQPDVHSEASSTMTPGTKCGNQDSFGVGRFFRDDSGSWKKGIPSHKDNALACNSWGLINQKSILGFHPAPARPSPACAYPKWL